MSQVVWNQRVKVSPESLMPGWSRYLLIACLVVPARVFGLEPVADIHLHYKWSQQEVTTARDAVRLLRQQRVILGVAIGTPAELALQLEREAPGVIVPVFSPYRDSDDWRRWAFDTGVVERTRAALASGDYQGIGELHLIGGFMPKPGGAAVLPALLRLAAAFDVPILLHTEFSRPDSLLALCRRHPDSRILWAHAGAILEAAQVAQVLDACSNVHAGLAARDPWRFVNHPITDDQARLLPAWRALMLKYQDRFMLGSDPVWPVDQMDSWDEPDTGWLELDRFWRFHRAWLSQLPAPVSRKIRCQNALVYFRRERQLRCD